MLQEFIHNTFKVLLANAETGFSYEIEIAVWTA